MVNWAIWFIPIVKFWVPSTTYIHRGLCRNIYNKFRLVTEIRGIKETRAIKYLLLRVGAGHFYPSLTSLIVLGIGIPGGFTPN